MLTLLANGAETMSSVWPSPGAFATRAAARLPIAPAWLSTTNGCLKNSDRPGTRMRARMSFGSPGDAPTTTCTVFSGYSKYAQAEGAKAQVETSAATSLYGVRVLIRAGHTL